MLKNILESDFNDIAVANAGKKKNGLQSFFDEFGVFY